MNFADPQRATLQVYMPYFVTNNFVTSQLLERALQARTLEVTLVLDDVHARRVRSCYFANGDLNGENGYEDNAIYCVFVTVTHVDQ